MLDVGHGDEVDDVGDGRLVGLGLDAGNGDGVAGGGKGVPLGFENEDRRWRTALGIDVDDFGGDIFGDGPVVSKALDGDLDLFLVGYGDLCGIVVEAPGVPGFHQLHGVVAFARENVVALGLLDR